MQFYAKVKSMQRDRLVRQVIETSGRSSFYWLSRAKKLLELATASGDQAAEVLRSALSLLEASAARNQGVLPLGLDPTSEWEGYAPLKHWKAAVAKWVARKNLQQFTGNRSTTCALLRRACEVEEDQEELEAMPRFPLTKLANTGPDQIRVRFLGGMSALNSTVHHYGHTSKGCPHQSCPLPPGMPGLCGVPRSLPSEAEYGVHVRKAGALRRVFRRSQCRGQGALHAGRPRVRQIPGGRGGRGVQRSRAGGIHAQE
jgi:hypothetical protein